MARRCLTATARSATASSCCTTDSALSPTERSVEWSGVCCVCACVCPPGLLDTSPPPTSCSRLVPPPPFSCRPSPPSPFVPPLSRVITSPTLRLQADGICQNELQLSFSLSQRDPHFTLRRTFANASQQFAVTMNATDEATTQCLNYLRIKVAAASELQAMGFGSNFKRRGACVSACVRAS